MPKTYNVTYVESDGWIVAWTDEEPGALAQERTVAEARASLKAAIHLLQADRTADMDEQPRIVARETITI